MRRGTNAPTILLLGLGLVLTGCATGHEPVATGPAPVEDSEPEPYRAAQPAPEPEPDADPEPEAEPIEASLVATATVATIEVFAGPDDTGERTHELDHPTEVGAPRVFLVEDRPGDGWLQVALPVRPNGSTGWIRESDVTLARNPYRITVDLEAYELTVHEAGTVRLTTPIGYGSGDTPTPGGSYFIIELLQPPDPTGVYGPFAFGLSGFSEVLTDFAGGEGVIGIHGTNQPDSIGTTVSAGCIRIDNDVVSQLATFLPLGTPVDIV